MNPLPLALLAPPLALAGLSLGRAARLLRPPRAPRPPPPGEPPRPALRRPAPLAALLAVPLKDVLQLATQAVPFVSREVVWHGHKARIGKGTTLLEAGPRVRLARA